MDEYYKEIADLFARAEKKIKKVERLGEGLTFPSVNQLRYCGYHLLRAYTSNDPNRVKDELREAKYHCQRAIFDSAEIEIIHYLETIRAFQDDYSTTPITDVVDDYISIVNKAEEARDIILYRTNSSVNEHSIINKNDDEKDALYKQADDVCKELEANVRKLVLARPELNKIIDRERKKWQLGFCGIIITFLGIIVALL